MNIPNSLICSISIATLNIEQFLIENPPTTSLKGFTIGIIAIEPILTLGTPLKPNIELVPTADYTEVFDLIEAISKKHNEYTESETSALFTSKNVIYTIKPSQLQLPLPILSLAGVTIKIKAYNAIYSYTFPTDYETFLFQISTNKIQFSKE